MKKSIFFLVVVFVISVFMAVILCFPTKAKAGEKELWSKREIIELCRANIKLANIVEALLEDNLDNAPYFVYDKENNIISLVPSSKFFLMVEFIVRQGRNDGKLAELANELIEDSLILGIALRHLTVKFSRK